MHIPDGFLDPYMSAATYAAFLGYTAYSLRRIGGALDPSRASLVTVLAAGIFAAQMLNWPIPGGTSLHFVGGGLAGILLGPYLGFLAMFMVLLVQTLVFHDGGITALGANMLNMGIVAVLAGHYVYRGLRTRLGDFAAAFLGGWLSITLAGLAAGLEIGFSPSFGYYIDVTVPVMTIWHAVLGVIEGLATALIVVRVKAVLPEVMED